MFHFRPYVYFTFVIKYETNNFNNTFSNITQVKYKFLFKPIIIYNTNFFLVFCLIVKTSRQILLSISRSLKRKRIQKLFNPGFTATSNGKTLTKPRWILLELFYV